MPLRRLALVLALALCACAPRQDAQVGGPFRLVDPSGAPVTERALKGKWSAVFFGFTHCPDACPTTLFALAEAETLLGGRAKDFQTVFISLDPARDTPEQIGRYLANEAFPKKALGLTGAPAQVDAAAKAYRVYYQKAGEGPDYGIDHSTVTYLMNPKGGFVCAIPHNAPPQVMADKITAAMRRGRSAAAC
jgi:protein SCO1